MKVFITSLFLLAGCASESRVKLSWPSNRITYDLIKGTKRCEQQLNENMPWERVPCSEIEPNAELQYKDGHKMREE